MKSKYNLPDGCPSAACGRCMWWQQKDEEGWGQCLLYKEKRWFKCMVCPEYEQDPDARLSL